MDREALTHNSPLKALRNHPIQKKGVTLDAFARAVHHGRNFGALGTGREQSDFHAWLSRNYFTLISSWEVLP